MVTSEMTDRLHWRYVDRNTTSHGLKHADSKISVCGRWVTYPQRWHGSLDLAERAHAAALPKCPLCLAAILKLEPEPLPEPPRPARKKPSYEELHERLDRILRLTARVSRLPDAGQHLSSRCLAHPDCIAVAVEAAALGEG